jgi:hypothetical protein
VKAITEPNSFMPGDILVRRAVEGEPVPVGWTRTNGWWFREVTGWECNYTENPNGGYTVTYEGEYSAEAMKDTLVLRPD